MEYYGRNPAMEGQPASDPAVGEWGAVVGGGESGLEESFWQMTLGRDGGTEQYPERPGEPDCMYYMRTGFCGYGATCRYNHPHDRNMQVAMLRPGEYPERPDEPVCQYYMKTGMCKFGATCKFHHPKYGSISTVPINSYGYPLRPGEKECSYYMKTGQCKYGISCKFHHPQLPTSSMPAPAPAFYHTVQTPPLASQYGAGVTSWQVARPPVMQNSYVQGAYGPLLIQPGVVPLPSWSGYPSQMAALASPGSQHAAATGSVYWLPHQLSPSAPSYQGPFSSVSNFVPSSSHQRENIFPERPGEPECLFYMKTGDCRYGSTCKYHHPVNRHIPKSTCVLSPLGLPLREGEPTCIYYAERGFCKFGPTCKYDHPILSLSYSPSASSLADMPVAPYPVGSSLATLAPSSSSSDLRSEAMTGFSNREGLRLPPVETATAGSMGSIYSKGTQLSNVQVTSDIATPSSSSAFSS